MRRKWLSNRFELFNDSEDPTWTPEEAGDHHFASGIANMNRASQKEIIDSAEQ